MSGLLDLLNSDLGKQIISGVSSDTNQSQDKTSEVMSMALPLLMGAMKRNTASSDGANDLMGALNNEKHDGSILDNLEGLFSGGVDEEVKNDGAGILNHVLGSSQNNVTNAISQKSGMDSGAVMDILKVAAPILLGYLGKQQRQQSVQSASGIESLLGGVLGGGSQQSLLESVLDGNNDGSVIDDIAGMVLGGSKKGKSGIGGLLGGLFGK